MPVRWAVVGCSDIVRRRAGDAIRAAPESSIVAMHSRNAELAREHCDKYGGQPYTDLDEMLARDDIDIVYIASEIDRHHEQTLAAAAAGKHVLVEKPMAVTTRDCREMIAACQQAGAHLEVAYYARFFGRAGKVRELIEEGEIGRPVRAHAQTLIVYDPAPDDPKYWRVNGRGGGNTLADVGSHRLDMLSYWFGPPESVYGLTDKLTMSYEANDTETALVRFTNGAHVTLACSANTPRFDQSIEVHGDRGSILTDPWSNDPITIHGRDDFEAVDLQMPENAHGPMVTDYAQAILDNRPPRFTGEDGMWATAVIEAAQRSAREGRRVEIEELLV